MSRSLPWLPAVALATALLSVAAVLACGGHDTGYTPGLGEIMSLQQMRHTKLWLAGEAGNWELAQYEIDELGEGFDDVLRFHPTHKESPIGPRDLLPNLVEGPLGALRTAAKGRDRVAFEAAFDRLTAACNSCHTTMRFGFNRVARPSGNPYPNQVFAAPTPVR